MAVFELEIHCIVLSGEYGFALMVYQAQQEVGTLQKLALTGWLLWPFHLADNWRDDVLRFDSALGAPAKAEILDVMLHARLSGLGEHEGI